MTLSNVDRHHVHGTAAVFMTPMFKGCNIPHQSLQLVSGTRQCAGRLASFLKLLFLSCVSCAVICIRLNNLSLSFITNINIFLDTGPHGGGRRACYETPDLSYDQGGEKKDGRRKYMGSKRKENYSYTPFEVLSQTNCKIENMANPPVGARGHF